MRCSSDLCVVGLVCFMIAMGLLWLASVPILKIAYQYGCLSANASIPDLQAQILHDFASNAPGYSYFGETILAVMMGTPLNNSRWTTHGRTSGGE